MSPLPAVSVLIVSYNTRQLLLEAVRSVVHEDGVEVIVVDNASHDGSPEDVAAHFPEVHLSRSCINLGFAAGVNRAAACARAETLLVLNSDARLQPDALRLLRQTLERHPRAALAGPALRYPDGRPQAAAFRFPGFVQTGLDLFPIDRLMSSSLNGRVQARSARRIDHPLGACMLIRRRAWEDVGPLDEGYFMYLEEVDWCRRARARGWEVWYEPAAVVVHHAGSSTSLQAEAMFAQLWRSRLRYYARFNSVAYNRAMHALIRLGLRAAGRRRDGRPDQAIQSVRRLVA